MRDWPKVPCAARGHEISLTPEVEVRQELVARLFALGYRRDDLRVEFNVRIASEKKRIDIGVFRRDAATETRHNQQNLFMIVECKKRGISASDFAEARKQLESYLSACLNATFGVVTDGTRTIVLQKGYHRAGDVRGPWRYIEVGEIPAASELEPVPRTILAPNASAAPPTKAQAVRIAELERALARAAEERERAEQDRARLERVVQDHQRRRAEDDQRRRAEDNQRRRAEDDQRRRDADAKRRAEAERAERECAAREEGARRERELQRERERERIREEDETARMWEDFAKINQSLDREDPGWRERSRRMRRIGEVMTWIVVALVVFILPVAGVYAAFVFVGRTAGIVAILVAMPFAVWAYKKLVD